jgi:hypothetical protein
LRPSTGHGKGDQEKQNANATDDVRDQGEPTSDITRIGPDETDNRSYNEQSEHAGQPVQDPACSDMPIVAR